MFNSDNLLAGLILTGLTYLCGLTIYAAAFLLPDVSTIASIALALTACYPKACLLGLLFYLRRYTWRSL